jgi:hypothetical protein
VERPAEHGIEERLLAEPIAGGEKLTPPPVIDREREHALELLDTRRSVLFVGVQDRLGVAGGAEAVALRFEHGPEFAVVVDLAVEDDLARAVFVGHGLMPAGAVDDREPPVGQRDVDGIEKPVAVGAAMGDRGVHRPHGGADVHVETPVEREDSADAAHVSFDPPPGSRSLKRTPGRIPGPSGRP